MRVAIRFIVKFGFLAGLFFLQGCGDGESVLDVSGTVTFQQDPVTEGSITFEDPSTGVANTVDLGDQGAYKVTLPPGRYAISIQPPMIEVSAGPESPPDESVKEMPNIPARYRRADTSGLTLDVNSASTQQDFDMQP